jgi:hypothetical protein
VYGKNGDAYDWAATAIALVKSRASEKRILIDFKRMKLRVDLIMKVGGRK